MGLRKQDNMGYVQETITTKRKNNNPRLSPSMDAPTSVTEGREERLACLQENYPSSLCGGPVCADCCPSNQEQPAEAGQLSGGLRPPAGTAS